MNLFDGGLFTFGMSLVATNTVMPVFVRKMGGSNLAVGLIPVIWTIGQNFPQILIANRTRRQPFKKPMLIKTALIQRLPFLVLGLLIWFDVMAAGREWAVLLFLCGLLITAIGSSLNFPGWFDLIAKLTPVLLRGRLFAVRIMLGAILGFLGGWLVKFVLDTVAYPANFALLFLAAFIAMMGSYIFLILLREDEGNPPRENYSNRLFLKQLPRILKSDVNFRNFLIADALMFMAITADAFYAVNAIQKFGLSDGFAGIFTVVIMSSLIIGNLFFGVLADRFGHRLNLFLAAGSTLLACLLALFIGNISVYYLVFVFSAFTVGLLQVSRLMIVAEICGENERATYVALANMITAPFVLIGIGGGWLADHFGYNAVFVMAGSFALLSALWYLFKVREPRQSGR